MNVEGVVGTDEGDDAFQVTCLFDETGIDTVEKRNKSTLD